MLGLFGVSRAETVPLEWQLGWARTAAETPAEWVPAQVPGAVQLDYARAKKWGPYTYGDNWRAYAPLEDFYYTYRTRFAAPACPPGQRVMFRSAGIDYRCEIVLNGETRWRQEGMFTPVAVELTPGLRPQNELWVRVWPAPKSVASPATRVQANHSVKPAVSYEWDWHPRLIPLGLWDETGVTVEPLGAAETFATRARLNEALDRATIDVTFAGAGLKGAEYVWRLLDPAGKPVAELRGQAEADAVTRQTTLAQPQLWWPHDQGTPALYTAELAVRAGGRELPVRRQKVGCRRVRLVMNEGAWVEPVAFPKSRSVAPAQFEINGRKVFVKGTNWVNPEIFPGIITRERYAELLTLARGANFNILRVWGGGIVNKESFFELCDELGLLVWQEFPLACNKYPDTPEYLAVLEQEATAIIRRLAPHASLALWSGGNELFNNWSGMDDQSRPLRLLNALTYRLDPETPFIATSPLEGMGHGHYVFRDPQTREEVFQLMARAHNTAYTEFGMPSPSPVAVLKQIIPEKDLWPPRAGTAWESHHAFKAWMYNTWLCDDTIAEYFGAPKSLEELVANGQLLQGEGYKAIFEEARRQKPYCAMALNWCYNEPWPSAANNSLIVWPTVLKPGYYAVQQSCRPVLASARFKKFKWAPGEELTIDTWMLSDAPAGVPAGKVRVSVGVPGDQRALLTWDHPALAPNTNQAGPVVRCRLPNFAADRIQVRLEVEGHPEYSSEYTLAFRGHGGARKKATTPALNQ